MSPIDRINQLNDEVALLRSQLSDARKQLESDSATIAKLAKDKLELVSALQRLVHPMADDTDVDDARDTISRHA